MNNHNKPELPAAVRISKRAGSIIGRQLAPASRANPARHCPRQQQSLLPANPDDSNIKICLLSKLAFTHSVKRLFGGGEKRVVVLQHQDLLTAHQTGFAPTASAAAVHLSQKITMATMPNADAKPMPCNLLVTGGCGFIGSNFINYIFDKWPEAKFVNLDKLDYGASPDNIVPEIRASLRYVFVKGTLLDQSLVEDILRSHQIDTIIHFAAITHVDDSYSDRIGTIQENVIATTTLLEAINAYGQLKRLVHISTDEVYGDSIDDLVPKNEQSPLNPTNPYAASKAACEVIVRSYHHSYKLPYVMVRMNNVYGPRQAYSKLIPKFTRLALEGKPYPLMGDGMHTRSWMYVDDCAEAIRRVTENGRIGEVYNIGTEFEKCNLHLTEMLHEKVQKLMAREATKIAFKPIPDRPYHDRRYHIDFAKIRDELAWTCVVPFEDGLTRTLDFYVKEYQRAQKEQTAAERPHG